MFHSLFGLEDVRDGTRGDELGRWIRHVDKRGVDVVGGKGEICGALALKVMLSERGDYVILEWLSFTEQKAARSEY